MRRHKKIVLAVGLMMALSSSCIAGNSWVNVSSNLTESSLTHVAVDPLDWRVMYCCSTLNIFKSLDAGSTWRNVLNLGASNNEILCLYVSQDGLRIYAGTRFGLRMSSDGGRIWRNIYKGSSKSSKEVYAVLENPTHSNVLWLGTGEGLVAFNTQSRAFAFVKQVGRTAIHSLSIEKQKMILLAVGETASYQSEDMGHHWKKIHSSAEFESENQTLNQFDVEEVMNGVVFLSGAFVGSNHEVLFSTKKGLWMVHNNSESAQLVDGNNLPTDFVTSIADADNGYFVATMRGVFYRGGDSDVFEEIYSGLDSKEVKQIVYHETGRYLLAATNKGLFRLSNISEKAGVPSGVSEASEQQDKSNLQVKLAEILKSFAGEPSILQIQEAAIRYAEVHPEKIKHWRQAASRKALLPTISLNTGYDQNQNIDLDRGGTNDPDRFIQGPDESSHDWSVTTNWNLSEIIWNDDQTSIDTRSKLMAELRDDILNEVNHLYFERRRLQVENKMYPAKDLAVMIEKELRLQELTAGLDALTGGYFSANLPKVELSPAGSRG